MADVSTNDLVKYSERVVLTSSQHAELTGDARSFGHSYGRPDYPPALARGAIRDAVEASSSHGSSHQVPESSRMAGRIKRCSGAFAP